MTAEQANAIDLSAILEKLGFHPAAAKGYDLWYYSPLRTEKTPSFHVHAVKNVWYDHGESRGGTVIDFVCAWLQKHNEDCTVADALRWLRIMMKHTVSPVLSLKPDFTCDSPALELRKVTGVQDAALINYLYTRGVPIVYARKYLKEVHVRNRETGNTFYALGLCNENGGYELRNKFFKGTLAPKGISFIRGAKPSSNEVHVFEGLMDFLSALVYSNASSFDGDVIILNSIGYLSQAVPYIKNYTYKKIYSWFDNDLAGQTATKALKKFAVEEKLSFEAMNELYAGHKDVNAWHMKKMEL